ncbi:Alpha/Beta hydrolase protein [Stachybotrys elegans]|uniref:Dipeptidyl-peptidase V n=1 Tax=Stachybotrys elegans TaxID=80388 RepID=A0A8K0SW74_9HYPO|nr:Alpha/Beta hydrolase protein [Stachybotrys elegans]
MTIEATRFTPEVLLSAPRRSAGVPNEKGSLILYTVTSYSFKTRSKTSQIRVMAVEGHASRLVLEDSSASDPFWLSNDEIGFFKPDEKNGTQLMAKSVMESSAKYDVHLPACLFSHQEKLAFCCSSTTTPQGHMYLPASDKKASTAQIYTSLFVRHWDTWNTRNYNSLWYGSLAKVKDQWVLEEPGLTNLLEGSRLSSPVPPFGGAGDFDVSSKGIAFVAKDPEINPALFTKTDLYYAPIQSFTEKPGPLQLVQTGSLRGYTISPTFSGDGSQIAFARMRHQQYESDKTRLMLVPDVTDLSNVIEFYPTEDGVGAWDSRPEGIAWSIDNKTLYVTAEIRGRTALWELPSNPTEVTDLPTCIYGHGAVSEVKPLGTSRNLLITSRNRYDSSLYTALDSKTKDTWELSSISKHGKSYGLDKRQMEEIWYPGAAGYDNHALVTLPSSFDRSKKYPLAFLIHGGPQGAWLDDWSTRWNPAIFAEQGYVVVCPNPTGSTGYGQAHTDAIKENWGGTPYEDLVKCFEYIEKDMPYVDTERAVALGASYGGYMINWIQGHDLGRKFKALVCHDGAFSTQSQWSTEELFFPVHDFGGTIWENRAGYEKWDPSYHTDKWATPMLVIHNELDYRLPISEGLAMFNVLQARGVPSKLVVFPDENHWVLKPENSLVWHREVLGWINKYSGIADGVKPKARDLALENTELL